MIEASQLYKPRSRTDWLDYVCHLDLHPDVTTRAIYEERSLMGCYLVERLLRQRPVPTIYVPDFARVVHTAMFDGVYRFAGQFRQQGEIVRIGRSFSTARPERIERELKMLKQQAKELSKKWDPYRLAAFMHIRFERIHPFMDGNGRVGRALLEGQLNTLAGPKARQSIVSEPFLDHYRMAMRMSEYATGFTQMINLLRQRDGLQPERNAIALPFRIAPLLPSVGREPALAKDLEYSRISDGLKAVV